MIIVLQNVHNMIRNQFSVKIKRFWSDSTRDYFNQCLTSYSQHERIIHESSCVNTLQQNGVAKRKNGHFLYTTQVFLFQKRVSKSYWGEVVLTATHLNRLPSRILGFKCPMKIISTFYLNMRTINHPIPKIFGCMCHLCMFIVKIRENWIQEQLNALLWDILQLKSDIRVTTHHPKFFVSVDVTCNEMSLIFLLLIFKGRIPSRKIRIGIPVSLIPFSLNFPKYLIQFPYLPSLNPSHPLSP